jgi:hypothetical protein
MISVLMNTRESTPSWIQSGVCDYFRARLNLLAPDWNRGKRGGRYTSGFSTTAFFFEWIAVELCPDFVSRLNKVIGEDGYDQEFFKKATGHDIATLWGMYQSSLIADPENDIPIIAAFPDLSKVSFVNEPSDPQDLDTVFEFQNSIPNHPGSILFCSTIKDPIAISRDFSYRIIALLYGTPQNHHPSYISKITIILSDMPGVAHMISENGSARKKEIHVSVNHICETYARNNNDVAGLGGEIRGVLIHELTHAWQYFEQVCLPSSAHNDHRHERAPGGVTEGIADFIRLRSGMAPSHWKKSKGRWDGGYDCTAHFLAWVEDTKREVGFVRKLNYAIGKSGWDVRCVDDICGVGVEALWKEYCGSF